MSKLADIADFLLDRVKHKAVQFAEKVIRLRDRGIEGFDNSRIGEFSYRVEWA